MGRIAWRFYAPFTTRWMVNETSNAPDTYTVMGIGRLPVWFRRWREGGMLMGGHPGK